MIEQIRPDLCVDLGMPVLDGFGAIRKIRADPTWAKLPVLAATAFAMRGDRGKRHWKQGSTAIFPSRTNSATLKVEIDRLMAASAVRGNESAD